MLGRIDRMSGKLVRVMKCFEDTDELFIFNAATLEQSLRRVESFVDASIRSMERLQDGEPFDADSTKQRG